MRQKRVRLVPKGEPVELIVSTPHGLVSIMAGLHNDAGQGVVRVEVSTCQNANGQRGERLEWSAFDTKRTIADSAAISATMGASESIVARVIGPKVST